MVQSTLDRSPLAHGKMTSVRACRVADLLRDLRMPLDPAAPQWLHLPATLNSALGLLLGRATASPTSTAPAACTITKRKPSTTSLPISSPSTAGVVPPCAVPSRGNRPTKVPRHVLDLSPRPQAPPAPPPQPHRAEEDGDASSNVSSVSGDTPVELQGMCAASRVNIHALIRQVWILAGNKGVAISRDADSLSMMLDSVIKNEAYADGMEAAPVISALLAASGNEASTMLEYPRSVLRTMLSSIFKPYVDPYLIAYYISRRLIEIHNAYQSLPPGMPPQQRADLRRILRSAIRPLTYSDFNSILTRDRVSRDGNATPLSAEHPPSCSPGLPCRHGSTTAASLPPARPHDRCGSYEEPAPIETNNSVDAPASHATRTAPSPRDPSPSTRTGRWPRAQAVRTGSNQPPPTSSQRSYHAASPDIRWDRPVKRVDEPARGSSWSAYQPFYQHNCFPNHRSGASPMGGSTSTALAAARPECPLSVPGPHIGLAASPDSLSLDMPTVLEDPLDVPANRPVSPPPQAECAQYRAPSLDEVGSDDDSLEEILDRPFDSDDGSDSDSCPSEPIAPSTDPSNNSPVTAPPPVTSPMDTDHPVTVHLRGGQQVRVRRRGPHHHGDGRSGWGRPEQVDHRPP